MDNRTNLDKRLNIDKNFLEQELKKFKSFSEIARENGWGRKTVGKYANEYGLVKLLGTDITDCQFGFLKVLKFSHQDKDKNNVWDCKCKCGNIIKVRSTCLIQGQKSCTKCWNYQGTNSVSGSYLGRMQWARKIVEHKKSCG